MNKNNESRQSINKGGFTLVEMLLVIIIATVIVALAAPNFVRMYSRFQLNKTADDLTDTSRWAQAMAISQQRIYALTFSGDHHSYGLLAQVVNEESDTQDDFVPAKGTLGKMRDVPQDIGIETQDKIQFYPDGTIDPATIEIASHDKKVVLSSTKVRGMMAREDYE